MGLSYSALQADCTVWLHELELELRSRPDEHEHEHLERFALQRFTSAHSLLLGNVCQSCMRLPRTCAMLPIPLPIPSAEARTETRRRRHLHVHLTHLACQALDCPVLYRHYYLHC